MVQYLAIILTALALVPAGVHLFELPNKIGLAQEAYLAVQGLYRGWALFGFALFGALGANLALALTLRDQRAPFRLALAAFLLMATSLGTFFAWTYPANKATANWTVAPEDWQALRRQWENAHAAGAGLTFLALCAVTLASLLARERAAMALYGLRGDRWTNCSRAIAGSVPRSGPPSAPATRRWPSAASGRKPW